MSFNIQDIDKKHHQELGYQVPETYFNTSKEYLMSAVTKQQPSKLIQFTKNKFVWYAAASIALLITILLFNQPNAPQVLQPPAIVLDTLNLDEKPQFASSIFIEEDVLLASLFQKESEVDGFISKTYVEHILADEYLDNYIIDTLIEDDLF